MPASLYIPKEVLKSIKDHIEESIPKALQGFISANEDEDTMTGQFGARLRTGSHTVEVEQSEISGKWRWSIDYTKFRGRGKGATESFIGADGIIELLLESSGEKRTKSLLFQAKMDWESDTSLRKQALLLSTLREASFFINYKEDSIEAISIDNVLRSRGVYANAKDVLPIEEALSEYFLKCKIGSLDLAYDPISRKLRWKTTSGLTVATQFSIPHRLKVKVEAPGYKEKLDYMKLIPNSEIHKHRMEAEQSEMIAPLLTSRTDNQKSKLRALTSAYHPDTIGQIEKFFEDLATQRMKEINNISESIKFSTKKGSG